MTTMGPPSCSMRTRRDTGPANVARNARETATAVAAAGIRSKGRRATAEDQDAEQEDDDDDNAESGVRVALFGGRSVGDSDAVSHTNRKTIAAILPNHETLQISGGGGGCGPTARRRKRGTTARENENTAAR